MCHVWPGVTPFNVWHLSYRVWYRFATATDAWTAERTKAAETAKVAGRRRR